jgi:hypothetical protein
MLTTAECHVCRRQHAIEPRRELISTAVWDTIRKHGLPVGCITADALPSYTSTRHRGIIFNWFTAMAAGSLIVCGCG